MHERQSLLTQLAWKIGGEYLQSYLEVLTKGSRGGLWVETRLGWSSRVCVSAPTRGPSFQRWENVNSEGTVMYWDELASIIALIFLTLVYSSDGREHFNTKSATIFHWVKEKQAHCGPSNPTKTSWQIVFLSEWRRNTDSVLDSITHVEFGSSYFTTTLHHAIWL